MRLLAGLACAILSLAVASSASAQSIAGQWQAIWHDAGDRHIIVTVEKTSNGHLKAVWYDLFRAGDPNPASEVTLNRGVFSFSIPSRGSSYEGRISSDGRTITGAITDGIDSTPLDLKRPSPGDVWPLPVSHHPPPIFVTTRDGIKIEVIDYGGHGQGLVFIPGLGNTASVFDQFAPRFLAKHHVFAMTRRGVGNSDRPNPTDIANYSAARLGDDVVDVIDALKLIRPVLAGWSMGGEELSSVGSHHPEKVSGLIYLDAAYDYAFYAPGNVIDATTNLAADLNALRAKIDQITGASTVGDAQSVTIIDDLLKNNLPDLEVDLKAAREVQNIVAKTPAAKPPLPKKSVMFQVSDAIMKGVEQFTDVKPPILAIFAVDEPLPPGWTVEQQGAYQQLLAMGDEQIKRFEKDYPSARVVRIAHAQHAVFMSNSDEVQREMDNFMDQLR